MSIPALTTIAYACLAAIVFVGISALVLARLTRPEDQHPEHEEGRAVYARAYHHKGRKLLVGMRDYLLLMDYLTAVNLNPSHKGLELV